MGTQKSPKRVILIDDRLQRCARRLMAQPRVVMTNELVVDVPVQSDDGLNLERVANDDCAFRSEQRAYRMLRYGLSRLVDDQPANSARRH